MTKSVVVAYPERATARLIEVNLERQGHRVRVAHDVPSALRLFVEEPPGFFVATAEIEVVFADDPRCATLRSC